jgi:putative endonuclease
MYYTYILKSKVDGFTYIGYTGDLRERIKEHNSGKTKSIKHRIPFEIVYYEAYRNKTDARKREIGLKNNSYQKEQLMNRIENSLVS